MEISERSLRVACLHLMFGFMLVGCNTGQAEKPDVYVAADGLVYKTVYNTPDFQIREAEVWPTKTIAWDKFSMPAARVEDPSLELGLGTIQSAEKLDNCYAQHSKTGWCTYVARMTTGSGLTKNYELVTNSIGMGGRYVLEKNNQPIWEGDLQAVTSDAILSTKQIGDEIAIEYLNTASDSNGKAIESILLTNGNIVVDLLATTPQYDVVFAPNAIHGKLLYFAKKYGQVQNNQVPATYFLVFDGKQIARYDSVFNQYCCWDGPPIQIHGNGRVVDFFANHDNSWYHVQAGDLSTLDNISSTYSKHTCSPRTLLKKIGAD